MRNEDRVGEAPEIPLTRTGTVHYRNYVRPVNIRFRQIPTRDPMLLNSVAANDLTIRKALLEWANHNILMEA